MGPSCRSPNRRLVAHIGPLTSLAPLRGPLDTAEKLRFHGSNYADDYYVTGGTITITQVSPMFEGSISNLTFEHVTIDDSTFQSTPHADGCTSAITSLSWSFTPTDSSM